jgi:nicotinamide-nucleotide amidase
VINTSSVDSAARNLAAALQGTDLQIATAESCTGGQLAARFARDADLGSHLERGFVVYSIDAKTELLAIERKLAERREAVTPEVTTAMAEGVLSHSHAQLAVAVTGFCGPQEKDEEVGLVFVATAGRQGTKIEEYHLGDIGREAVLDAAVAIALTMLNDTVRS